MTYFYILDTMFVNMILSVTSNLVRAIHCSDKMRGPGVCIVRYDVYSNSFSSKCIVSLMCTLFYIRVHEVKLDRTEQNEQYLIGQTIVIPNEGYISLGTTLNYAHLLGRRSVKKLNSFLSCQAQILLYIQIDSRSLLNVAKSLIRCTDTELHNEIKRFLHFDRAQR
jgi:hypothetical protein